MIIYHLSWLLPTLNNLFLHGSHHRWLNNDDKKSAMTGRKRPMIRKSTWEVQRKLYAKALFDMLHATPLWAVCLKWNSIDKAERNLLPPNEWDIEKWTKGKPSVVKTGKIGVFYNDQSTRIWLSWPSWSKHGKSGSVNLHDQNIKDLAQSSPKAICEVPNRLWAISLTSSDISLHSWFLLLQRNACY